MAPAQKLEDKDFFDALHHLDYLDTILDCHVTRDNKLKVGLQQDLEICVDMRIDMCIDRRIGCTDMCMEMC